MAKYIVVRILKNFNNQEIPKAFAQSLEQAEWIVKKSKNSEELKIRKI